MTTNLAPGAQLFRRLVREPRHTTREPTRGKQVLLLRSPAIAAPCFRRDHRRLRYRTLVD
jgi:hypothetical protein